MKVFLDMIGCRLNQAEIETMARQFRAAGHEIVGTAEDAQLAVVNTCSVTSAAASDSRGRIRAAARAGVDEIVATGCWVTLSPDKARALPAVKQIVPNDKKEILVAEVLGLPADAFDLEPLARAPLPGLHMRTRAFIKVQDGCDNHCTFCITTVARGAGRSRSTADVIADVQSALDGGTQEVVLTGVHLGSWGADLPERLHLRDLVDSILAETDVPRLRLSSLEPWDLDEGFFSLWKDPRLCPHLHLPLQSGSPTVLRRMLRNTNPESFRELVRAARAAIPQAAITTDVIAGFPGETEEEFAETLAFLREIGFAGGHVFTYSARSGTAAARMKNMLPVQVRKQRNAVLREAFAEMAEAYQRPFAGTEVGVLWESTTRLDDNGWELTGLTGNYMRVNAVAPEPRWNQIDRVRLQEWTPQGFRAEIL